MTDYLKELGLTLGGNGEWNGMEFYLILAVVVAVLMAGIVWVLFRFRKKGPREERLDEAGESVIDDQDTDILAPYDAESVREEGTAFFGSGEERQMQLESDIQGVSHRLSVTTVLFPLLFLVVLVFVYLDMRQRIGEVTEKDVREVQEGISGEISAMSGRLEEMEKTVEERLKPLERRTADMAEALKTHESRLEEVVASKGKQEALEGQFTKRLQRIGETLALVQKDTAEYGAKFEKLSNRVDARIGQSLEAISEQKKTFQRATETVAELGNDIEEIKKSLLDLELEFKLLKEAKADKVLLETFRAEQERIEEEFTQQIQILRSDITRLAEQFVRAGTGQGASPQQEPRAGDTSQEGGAEGPGSIFEQDIPR